MGQLRAVGLLLGANVAVLGGLALTTEVHAGWPPQLAAAELVQVEQAAERCVYDTDLDICRARYQKAARAVLSLGGPVAGADRLIADIGLYAVPQMTHADLCVVTAELKAAHALTFCGGTSPGP
ncbi:MAG TPA: hypothetical protein VI316_04455 [Candidatus Dormibacteraeota bacterium]